jgi:acyl-CoA oxidase
MSSNSKSPTANKINQLLEPDNRQSRNVLRNLFKDPVFVPRYNVSLQYERTIALERLRKMAESKAFSVKDFEGNARNIFAGRII